MPSIFGFGLTGVLTGNYNNVAFEASPFTTAIEVSIGETLQEMLGYKIDAQAQNDGNNSGWGHTTADGFMANLESIQYVLFHNESP